MYTHKLTLQLHHILRLLLGFFLFLFFTLNNFGISGLPNLLIDKLGGSTFCEKSAMFTLSHSISLYTALIHTFNLKPSLCLQGMPFSPINSNWTTAQGSLLYMSCLCPWQYLLFAYPNCQQNIVLCSSTFSKFLEPIQLIL